MWNFKSKSVTPKDFINQMCRPDYVGDLSEEYIQVLKTKVPSKLKAYTFAGSNDRLLFKRNRVNLPGDKDSKIMNASYIQGYKRSNAYIATETPQSATGAQALWETVWQHQTNIIVMLNKPEEEKSDCYWSPVVGESLKFGSVTVGTIKISMILPNLQITKLVVVEKGHALSVYHFLYTNWQDLDNLPSEDDFLKMLFMVRKYSENTVRFEGYHSGSYPILVHCCDGLDRTMTYIAIDRSISKYIRTKKVNVFSTVSKLRNERYNCLSDVLQYYFCYSTMCYYIIYGCSAL